MKRFILWLILCGFALTACGAVDEPQVVVITQEVTVVVVVTATPEPVSAAASTSASEVDAEPVVAVGEEWVLPEDALAHVGEVVSVKVDQAHCSYREGINGKPTFCNDKPFPDHDFTFVVWGKDWSAYDSTCVVVEGEVEVYDGKAQIVVEDQDQVGVCP